MDSTNEDVTKVQVKFKTQLAKYKVTEKPFSVPINLNRRGLSQVINHLLNFSAYPAESSKGCPMSSELRFTDLFGFVTNSS